MQENGRPLPEFDQEAMMKKVFTLTALAILTVSLSGLYAEEGKKQGSSEKTITGTIVRLDMTSKTLTVADAKGMNWMILWNDATRILGGEMKEGQPVQLGYTEKQNKNWATWIRVGEANK
jgi:hypothetical protein